MPVYKKIAPLAYMNAGGTLTINADNLQYVENPMCQIGANVVPTNWDGSDTIVR